MKLVNINGINPTQPARLQQPEPMRPQGSETASGAQSSPDQINVSSRAEETSRLIARAGEFGDFRHERVDSLREAIQSDQYQVPSSTIADAILRDESA
jgi:flagellar biosynthesis anti-sigma factor FlgM